VDRTFPDEVIGTVTVLDVAATTVAAAVGAAAGAADVGPLNAGEGGRLCDWDGGNRGWKAGDGVSVALGLAGAAVGWIGELLFGC
jgi:hypothetical protein